MLRGVAAKSHLATIRSSLCHSQAASDEGQMRPILRLGQVGGAAGDRNESRCALRRRELDALNWTPWQNGQELEMKKFSLVLALSVIAVFSGSASGADMAPRIYSKAVAPAPIASWTGFYAGLNAGGAFDDVRSQRRERRFRSTPTV